MALLPGSPAIDAGDNTDAPMWDQRGPGFRRIVNGTIDIGAFEVQAPAASYPTRQPLPDPVAVQALGTPGGPLVRQLPTFPADPSLLLGTFAPDGKAGQLETEPVPVPTAGGQLTADSFLPTDAGDGQPRDALWLLSGIAVELPALGLSG
jgi:hypothetical protein